VSVPVKAFTAAESGREIRLNQLHKDCHSRIQYRKVCPTHGELANDEIVKGYEYAKGQYVVIDDEELKKLRPESDKSINLEGFIEAGSVDAVYQAGRTYYLTPDGVAGQKPFVLLRKTMEEKGIQALARMVISGRENLVLIRPFDDLLAVTTLVYAAGVKPTSIFDGEVVDSDFSDEERKLTETLVGASMIEDFDYSAYEDGHVNRMRELIEAKVEGKELVSAPSQEEPQILNLMEALKQSVANAQAAEPAKKKMAGSARKRTPARKKARKSG
jgi:DNA end-binding protein Ku